MYEHTDQMHFYDCRTFLTWEIIHLCTHTVSNNLANQHSRVASGWWLYYIYIFWAPLPCRLLTAALTHHLSPHLGARLQFCQHRTLCSNILSRLKQPVFTSSLCHPVFLPPTHVPPLFTHYLAEWSQQIFSSCTRNYLFQCPSPPSSHSFLPSVLHSVI